MKGLPLTAKYTNSKYTFYTRFRTKDANRFIRQSCVFQIKGKSIFINSLKQKNRGHHHDFFYLL